MLSAAPPTNLQSTTASAYEIDLTWQNNDDSAAAVEIDRSIDGMNFSPLVTIDPSQSNYGDASLSEGTHYWYEVFALDPAGNSDAAATDRWTSPAAPSDLNATAVSNAEIYLSWSSNSVNASATEIDRASDGQNFETLAILSASADTFYDSTVGGSSHEWYRVIAIGADGTPSPADSADASTLEPTPDNLSAVPATSGTEIDLSWSESDASATIEIDRSNDGSNFAGLCTLPSGADNYVDTGLSSQTQYWYRVEAIGYLGTSQPATVDTATNPLPPPTVTATTASDSEIDLSWGGVDSSAPALEIDRSSDGTNYSLLTTVPSSWSNYNDTGLDEGSHYWYAVKSVGPGEVSDPGTADAATAPRGPSGLAVTAESPFEVDLSWTDNSSASPEFEIDRSVDGINFDSVATAGSGQITFADTNVAEGVAYTYQVIAVKDGVGSLPSNSADVTPSTSPPPDVAVTSTGLSVVTLVWNAPPAATSYTVLRQGPGDASFLPVASRTANFYGDNSVLPQQTYSYEVEANWTSDTSNFTSDPSDPVTAIIPTAAPSAPANLTVTKSSPTQVALNWTAAEGGVTAYHIERIAAGDTYAEIASVSPTVTSYIDSSLQPSTAYTYWIVAENSGAFSGPSNTARAATAPSAPTHLSVQSASSSSISIAWTASIGATGYQVLRKASGESTYSQIGLAGLTTFTDSAVLPLATYSYEVAAVGDGGVSSTSPSVSATTPGGLPLVPSGLIVTGTTSNSVSLMWSAATGASGYQVLRRGYGDSAFSVVGTSAGTSFTDSGVLPTWSYAYEVVATNSAGISSSGPPAFADTPAVTPGVPTGLSASVASNQSVLLAWSPPPGTVTAYHVERSTDGVNFAEIGATTATNFTDANSAPGSTDAYRIRAENTGVLSDYSSSQSVTLAPASVTGIQLVSDTSSSIALDWSAVTGATSYTTLRESPGQSSYVSIGNSVTPGITDAALAADSTYSYEIVAADSGGNAPPSSPFTLTTPSLEPSAPPDFLAATNSSTGVTLTWSAPSGSVTAYHLERSTDGVSFAEIVSDLQDTRYADESLRPSTTYFYRLRAENDGSLSPYTAVEQVTTLSAAPPAMPSNLSAVASAYGVALQWAANSEGDLAGYNVLRGASSGGPFTQLNTSPITSPAYHDTSAPQGADLYYRVVAVSDSNLTSVPATAVATRLTSTAATPTNLSAAQVTASGVLLTWSGPDGVTFNVYKNGQPIASAVTGTAYLDSTVSPGSSYSYSTASVDGSGAISAPCAALSVTTPAAPSSYDTAPPSAPTSLQATALSDTYVELTWQASTDNVAVTSYEILRNGVQVGATSPANLYFYDSDPEPGGPNNYSVIAFDAAYNQSLAATVSGTANADQTHPNTPIDLQVTEVSSSTIWLSWVQPWDNIGVVGYQLTRTSGVYPYTTTNLGTIAATTYKDSGLLANVTYSYSVVAVDAAHNSSQSADISATTGGATGQDSAPNQYIPDAFQNYLYGDLTTALRQKIAALPIAAGSVKTPYAAGWLDLSPYAGTNLGFDTVLAGTPVFARNVYFHDLNGNGFLDPGESAWLVPPTAIGAFAAGDTVVSGATPPVGASGSTGVFFIDKNGNGLFDPGSEQLIPNPALIQGHSGLYDYYDRNGTGFWQTGDPVWLDTNGNHVFDSAETVIYDPNHLIQAGLYGKTNGIQSYDVNGDSSSRIIWADQTTFRQDFAAVYPALDALAPHFANPSGDPYTAWSAGDMLSSISAQVTAGTGTVNIDVSGGPTSLVTGNGTHFKTQLVPGDNIKLGAGWYPVASVTDDTHLSLGSTNAYRGNSILNAPLSIINWTKIPEVTDAGTGLSIHYVRGEVDSSSVLFPQQFQELHNALNQLTVYPKRFDQWLFDEQTSRAFIQLATQAVNASDSLFGNGNNDRQLKLALLSGDADPGSVFTSGLLTALQSTVVSLERVFVRGSGPRGWQMETDDQGHVYGPARFDDYHIIGSLLGPYTGALSSRVAGQWSTGDGSIAPVYLSEIGSVLGPIENNGLWLDNSGPTYQSVQTVTPSESTGESWGPSDSNQGYVAWPELRSTPDGIDEGEIGWIEYHNGNVYSFHDTGWHVSAYDFKETVTLPSAVNHLGGAKPTTLMAGPDPADIDIDLSGWTWGATLTIAHYLPDQVRSIIEANYAAAKASAPNPPFDGQTEYVTEDNVPTGLPHLYWSSWLAVSPPFNNGFLSSSEVPDYSYSGTTTFMMKAPNSVFGLIPTSSAFTYSPTHSAPQPKPLGNLPKLPLPLTTRMDYLNVIPDVGIDGILHAPADLTSFGLDSGSISFQAQRDLAQSYIPIFGNSANALPINAYLTQGAFGTSTDSVGSLLDQDITAPNADQDGTPFAYSLDTRVRLNLLLTQGTNQIKRVEVIRPGGNAVVFNFAWDATAGMFSPTGTPAGWNGRDANQTYVLRSLNAPDDNAGLAYELLFPNGTIQTFGQNGALTSVADASTGLAQSPEQPVWGSNFFTGNSALPLPLGSGQKDTADSQAYNLTFNWSNGRLASVDYQTKDQAKTIHTAMTYGGSGFDANNITALTKTVGGSPLAAFSYTLSGPDEIDRDGVEIIRGGSFADGNVAIFTILPSSAAYQSGSVSYVEYQFDKHGLLVQQTTYLSESDQPESTATTLYKYQDATGTYANGSPKWSKVVKVTNPNGSWAGYEYDTTTGWITKTITPFESGDWNPGNDSSDDRAEEYGYDASLSGNGQAADPAMLVQPPDTVTDFILGVQTAETFYNYDFPVYPWGGPPAISSRRALTNAGSTWANAGFFSQTTITAFDASTTTSIAGNSSTTKSGPASSLTYTSQTDWFGNVLSQFHATINTLGVTTASDAAAIGSPFSDTTTETDSFGRVTQSTSTGGTTTLYTYTPADWYGPSQVTGPDGAVTKYTYTPLGQVATKVIYAGTTHSVKYSYVYDAAGNATSVTQQAVDGSGNPKTSPDGSALSETNIYAYDAQGRLTQESDNAGGVDITRDRVTKYAYTNDGTYNVTTVTNPDQSTAETKTYLDGFALGSTGSAVSPDANQEGVVFSDYSDANGRHVSAGSTYTKVSTDGGKNWATTYVNVLGQAYLVQQSDPASSAVPGSAQSYSDAFTSFDASGRPTKQVALDGTTTRIIYNPVTGQVGATWVDLVGDNQYDPVTESKTVFTPAPLARSAADQAGMDTKQLSTSGTQDDNSVSWNGGMNSSETVNGATTSSETFFSSNGYTTLVTNDDGTQTQDVYTDGLLSEEDQLDTGEGTIASTTYTYDDLRRLKTSVDYTGTTSYTYFQDGSQKSVQTLGHNAQTVTAQDPGTGNATSVTNSNNSTTNAPENDLGLTKAQSGAGVIASKFGYDKDGQLTSLTTYPSGEPTNTDDSAAATTTWEYDPATGDLKQKTYDDGSRDTFKYNTMDQLATEIEPGMTGTFTYDDTKNLSDATLVDSQTGLVESKVLARDDQQRPQITLSTDNGKSYANVDTYTPQQDLEKETFGAAGNTSVGYGYYPTSNYGPAGTPDGLQSLTVAPPTGPAAHQTYAYNSSSKRLQTITVNGLTFTYQYLPDSNQLQSISAGGVVTTFTPDTADKSRLGGITVYGSGDDQPLYQSSYQYNQLDQITSADVTQTVAGDGGSTALRTDNLVYTYGTGPTDNGSDANSLTQVTDNCTTTESYAYDGVGNFEGTSLGSVNRLNQYANLTYNARGDVTNDGTYAYTYDANDRMISVTPHDTTQSKLTYGYDSQGRRTWKDVYEWDDAAPGGWVLSYSRHYVYDGTSLVGELDQNNTLLTGYTWGANGQLLAVTDYTQSTPKTYVSVIDTSGNTALLVDPTSGSVAASYRYDAYGNLLSATGPAQAFCSILGKSLYYDIEDRSIGHALNRDVRLNIWYERDPAGELVGGVNLYRYLSGDPINCSDPKGLAATGARRMILCGGLWSDRTGYGAPGSAWVVKPNGTLVEVPDVYGNRAIEAWAQGYVNASHGIYPAAVTQLVGSGPVDPELAAYIFMGEVLEGQGISREQIGGLRALTGAHLEVQDWLHDQQPGVIPSRTILLAMAIPPMPRGSNPMNGAGPEPMEENARPMKIRSDLSRSPSASGPGQASAAAEKPAAASGKDPVPAQDAKPIDSTRPQHGTTSHDATAFNQAKAWKADPNTVESRFNQNLVDLNGNEVPGFRPDSQRIRITADGKRVIDVVEVQSPFQSAKFMNDKIAAIKKALGPQAGDIKWVPRTDTARN